MYFLAQANATEGGLMVLQDSLNIAQDTAEAWNGVWQTVISPDSNLWYGIVQLGLIVAALSLLYLTMTEDASRLSP